MSKNQPTVTVSLLLVVVIVSCLAGGLVSYAVTTSTQPKYAPIGNLGANLFLITQNDTTATYKFNTTYQNLEGTGQAMLVTVVASMKTSSEANSKSAVIAFIAYKLNVGGNGITFCNCYSELAVGGNNKVPFPSAIYNNTNNYGIVAEANVTTVSTGRVATLQFWVPSGFYYMVNDTHALDGAGGGAAPAIVGWLQTVPPTGFGSIIAPVIMALRRPF
jgi:hypothetical protein